MIRHELQAEPIPTAMLVFALLFALPILMLGASLPRDTFLPRWTEPRQSVPKGMPSVKASKLLAQSSKIQGTRSNQNLMVWAARNLALTSPAVPVQNPVADSAPLAQEEPLGLLQSSGEVFLDEVRVPPESSIFPGSLLRTGDDGVAVLQVHGLGTIHVGPKSRVALESPQGYLASLEVGGLGFQTSGEATNFRVRMGDFVLIPDPKAGSVSAELRREIDGSAQIQVSQGSVGVIGITGPQSAFVPAGSKLHIFPDGTLMWPSPVAQEQEEVEPARGIPSTPQATRKTGSARWVLLGVGGAVASAAAAALSLRDREEPVSPSSP